MTAPSEGEEAVQGRVVSAVGSVGIATLLSRILGLLREVVVARAFGAGPATDAFFVAFSLPNLMRRLLAEGAVSVAIIPVLTETLTRGGREALAGLARALWGVGTLTLLAASGLGVLVAPWVLAVMVPGWHGDPGLFALVVMLTRVTFPYLLLVGLAALAMGLLNVHHRFFTAAAGPALMNAAMIVAVLGLAGRVTPPILSLAVGVLAGGVSQLLIQLPEVRGAGVPLRPSLEWGHPALREIGRRLVPAVFALAAVHLTVVVNQALASLLPGGSRSYLWYADRVMEFPLGVFGIALATAAMPSMAAQAARGEHGALRGTLGFSLRLAAFVAIPSTVGLVVLSRPIVALLFERGAFGPEDTQLTAQTLVAYAAGLVAFSATRLTAQVFYALGDARTPVRMGYVAVAANLVLAVGLMGPLRHVGLALASSLSAYVNLLGLLWLLRRRLGPLGGGELARSVARTALASAVLALWCLWAGGGGTGWAGAVRTLGVIAAGIVVFGGAAAALRAPELTALLGMLRRRGQTLPPGGSG